MWSKTQRCARYLVRLLHLTDLLSSGRVVCRKHLPADRVLPLVVDENLRDKTQLIVEAIQQTNATQSVYIQEQVSLL